jgi:predicted TIM-barrel fold metal-dependent hydrolase
MNAPRLLSRREFLVSSAAVVVTAPLAFPATATSAEPIIDIHQHTNYGGKRDPAFPFPQIAPARSHADLLAHQRGMGVTKTILLPAGRPVTRKSTLEAKANGLDGTVSTNDDAVALARQHPNEFVFGANEVSDLDDAPSVVEKYLKLGAVVIGEQKFGVECDSPEMQKLFKLAEAYQVPILMHWQFGSYNHGFDRFHTMLKKYPKVNFIGHAQTWWANIDRNHADQTVLYPKGPVTAGGLTDRYLADYPNMFGDLSAGSGLNALTRDEEFTRGFLERHQDKLLFGSDCSDPDGRGEKCQGSQTIAVVRRLAANRTVERKLLYENARKMLNL